jgi:hypothetical protein
MTKRTKKPRMPTELSLVEQDDGKIEFSWADESSKVRLSVKKETLESTFVGMVMGLMAASQEQSKVITVLPPPRKKKEDD